MSARAYSILLLYTWLGRLHQVRIHRHTRPNTQTSSCYHSYKWQVHYRHLWSSNHSNRHRRYRLDRCKRESDQRTSHCHMRASYCPVRLCRQNKWKYTCSCERPLHHIGSCHLGKLRRLASHNYFLGLKRLIKHLSSLLLYLPFAAAARMMNDFILIMFKWTVSFNWTDITFRCVEETGNWASYKGWRWTDYKSIIISLIKLQYWARPQRNIHCIFLTVKC